MRASWKRLLAFVLLFAGFYAGLAASWSKGLSHWIIDVATVEPAAWLARLISGDPAIVAVGSRIRAPDASINVLFGCEGTDVLMLLAAAILVSPVRWRDRLLGVLAGTAFVFVVNQARVLGLFFALRYRHAWFGQLHGLLAPLAVVLLVSLFFLLWLRRAARQATPDALAA
jgi:exosortase/archaeosortase family protein